MRQVNTPFWLKLQEEGGSLTELIDFQARNIRYHWTTNNVPMTATFSASDVSEPTTYLPFPGGVPSGVLETSDLAVSVVDFVMANTGNLLKGLLASTEFHRAKITVSRVFIDTPDLDRMVVFRGEIGDFSYDRVAIAGQARNLWQSLAVQWPYFTYQDTCVWRFGSAGCGFDTSSITISSSGNYDGVMLINYSGDDLGPTGTFDFGRLTLTEGVNSGCVRTIRRHIRYDVNCHDILLSHPLPSSADVTVSFDIYPGCKKRLVEDCTSRYNNAENALLFPWIPVQEQVVTV